MAGPTRLELATSGVTGQRSNQLNYDPDALVTEGRILSHLIESILMRKPATMQWLVSVAIP